MALPRTVTLVANTPLTVDLSGDVHAHSLVRLAPAVSAGPVWCTTDGTTPTAYANGAIATWYTADGELPDAYVEVPDTKTIKLLSASAASVRIERVPPAQDIRELDGGFGPCSNARYPSVNYSAVTTIDVSGVQAAGRWARVDLPLTTEAWLTTDGSTPSSGNGIASNTLGRFSWAIQVPDSQQIKVWLSTVSGGSATTRIRVAAILPPRRTGLWAV